MQAPVRLWHLFSNRPQVGRGGGEHPSHIMPSCAASPIFSSSSPNSSTSPIIPSPSFLCEVYPNLTITILLDAQTCTNCSAGSESEATFGSTACRQCVAGTFAFEGSEFGCHICPAGYVSGDSASACTPCDAGESSPPNASACEPCLAGTFTDGAGQICTPCPAGSWQPLEGTSACAECVPGYYIARNGSTTNCTACPEGKSAENSGQATCDSCPAGTYSPEASIRCIDCIPGTYSPFNLSASCLPCPPGNATSSPASTSCPACPPGFDTRGQGSAITCVECASGSFSPGGVALCTPCASGFTRGNGSTSVADCIDGCEEGTFNSTDGLSPCEPCARGTYSDSALATSCTACDAGLFSPSPGATSCQPCDEGTSSAEGSWNCTTCTAGTFSLAAAPSCTPCTMGSRSESDGASECFPCPPGSYSGADGASSCTECEAGKFAPLGNSTACQQCNPGNFSLGGALECSMCDPGKYQSSSGTSFCIDCDAFTSTGGPGSSQSTDCKAYCQPGNYGEDNGIPTDANPCMACSNGTHAPFYQMVACIACPAGKYVPGTGASSCIPCPLNTYGPGEGLDACTPCPTVDVGEGGGATEQTFTLEEGSTSVTQCMSFSPGTCSSSPRKYPASPVYTAGANAYGQAVSGAVYVDTDGEKFVLPTIITCDLIGGAEIAKFSAGQYHTLLLTARPTGTMLAGGALEVVWALWAMGINRYGQLGVEKNVGTVAANAAPLLVPRLLFPTRAAANSVSAALSNNIVNYAFWDFATGTRAQYTLTLPDGSYSPEKAASEASRLATAEHGHPENLFRCTYDSVTQGAIIYLGAPGLQIDFTSTSSAYNAMGFNLNDKVPPLGTVNEVSEEAQNNIFAYRVWCLPNPCWCTPPDCSSVAPEDRTGCGSELTTEAPSCGGYKQVVLKLPDGIYTLDMINAAVDDAVFANGHGREVFRFRIIDSHIQLTVTSPLFQVAFSVENSFGSLLGFDGDQPPNGPPYFPANPLQPIAWTNTSDQRRGYLNGEGSGAAGTVFEPQTFLSGASGMSVKQTAAGSYHTLALAHDDTSGSTRLFAIGSNSHGQLGSTESVGDASASNQVPLVISKFDQLQGGLGVSFFRAGGRHSLVVADDGTLWAFGSNKYGQLGVTLSSGTDDPVPEPQSVDMANVTGSDSYVIADISLGMEHTLLLMVHNETGETQLWSFGSNLYGQLGRSPSTASRCTHEGTVQTCSDVWRLTSDESRMIPVPNPTPGLVEGLSQEELRNMGAMQAGGYHSLLVASNGMTWCFGNNRFGQCGHQVKAGDIAGDWHEGNVEPIVIGTVLGPFEVSPSEACCAPACQGGACGACLPSGCPAGEWLLVDSFGQGRDRCVPCPLGAKRATSIEAGEWHTIVRTDDETLYSFGLNLHGELMRTSANLGIANPNFQPELIPPTAFGDGKQKLVGQRAGASHSLVQMFRPMCEAGNHSVDRRSPCLRCEPGSYVGTTGKMTDPSVSPDQNMTHPYSQKNAIEYVAEQILLSCSLCPSGKFSGDFGSTSCSTCLAGAYALAGASSCHNCSLGTFSNSSEVELCDLCSAGFSTLSEGQTHCDSCQPGTFSPAAGEEQCTPCDRGSFSNIPEATSCGLCSPEQYQDEYGQTQCKDCPNNKRAPRVGATSILECTDLCSPGSKGVTLGESEFGGEPCTPCEPGQRSSDTTISDGSGATGCVDCLPGKFSLTQGSACVFSVICKQCWDCPEGTYTNDTRTSQCSLCTAGSSTNGLEGQVACSVCTPGTFTPGDGVGSCEECLVGTKQPNEEETGCIDCDPGFSSGTAATDCTICPVGSYSVGGNFAGRISSPCLPCEPGYFSNSSGASQCMRCDPGSFSASNASICSLCDPGTFAESYNQTACDDCAAGSFANSTGRSECELCHPGTYSPGGLALCLECDPGFYAFEPGTESCNGCLGGEFSGAGASICDTCIAGTFSTGEASVCTDCTAGTISALNGSSSCDDCLGGSFSDADGLSACTLCSPGDHAPSEGLTFCSLCLAGTFSNSSGAVECDICAVGEYADSDGAFPLHLCPLLADSSHRCSSLHLSSSTILPSPFFSFFLFPPPSPSLAASAVNPLKLSQVRIEKPFVCSANSCFES